MTGMQTRMLLFSAKHVSGDSLGPWMNRLVMACPDRFKDDIDNHWSDYAMKLFYHGGVTEHWKWKSNNEAERDHQKRCFISVLTSPHLDHEDKEAVAGWILSEML